MRQSDLKAELKRRMPDILPNQGIHWEQGGYVVRLNWGNHKVRFSIHPVAQPSLSHLKEVIFSIEKMSRNSSDPIPLIVAPYLGEDARLLCREHNLLYLDLSGNVWIAHRLMVIEKEVAASKYDLESGNRSPFADRASLILRDLLKRGAVPAGVREIASSAEVSPGYASKILRAAEASHYVVRDESLRYRIKNHRELLGDWSASYNWRRNDMESFFLMPGRSGSVGDLLRDALPRQGPWALSLHAGNNLIEPFAQNDVWHIYAGDQEIAHHLKSRLELKPVSKNSGNVVLMKPYYRESIFKDAREIQGFRIVSDLQLYLDLKHYPIRGVEAASQILERRLARAWKLERSHARV